MAEEWVKVTSADELHAGLAVQLRPCDHCGRSEMNILGNEVSGVACDECGVVGPGFEVLDSCDSGFWPTGDFAWCPEEAIREGRLFRLVLTEPDASTVTRTREMEVLR